MFCITIYRICLLQLFSPIGFSSCLGIIALDANESQLTKLVLSLIAKLVLFLKHCLIPKVVCIFSCVILEFWSFPFLISVCSV